MNRKKPGDYLKVVTRSGDDAAEIFLYGVIGKDFWWDDNLKEESITDLEFVKQLRELEKTHSRINIRINSPGGSMYHGNAIITAIQQSKAEIHTYNDGLAASMAADIWLCAKNRHMAPNALLMIHSPSTFMWGTARDLRKEADNLDKWAYTAIAITAAALGKSEDEVMKWYDYEDHWFTAKEAMQEGFIKAIEAYKVDAPPANVQSLHPRLLLEHYAEAIDRVPAQIESADPAGHGVRKLSDVLQGIVAQMEKFFTPAGAQDKPVDMNFEDFKKSLEDGTLDRAAIMAHLSAGSQPPAPTHAPAPAPAPAAPVSQEPVHEPGVPPPNDDANARLVQELQNSVELLTQEIQALKQSPGAGRTGAPAPADAAETDPEIVALKRQFEDNMKNLYVPDVKFCNSIN